MHIFLKTERIAQGVRNFFSSKNKTPNYLSGVQKNISDWEGIDTSEEGRKTKRFADVKSRSNTGR